MGCASSKQAAQLQEAGAEVARQLLATELRDMLPEGEELEKLRLKALQDCRILDTAAEVRFDTITKLLQGIFKTPMALVSLIDCDRLVFHSTAGPAGPGGRRIHSFCDESLAAANPTMMVVEDTLQDARFQHSQFVEGPPHVRFYSGAPLVSSEGYIYGSLGVLDLVPRKFPAEMYNMICNFAELVVRELERDKVLELQARQAAQAEARHRCMTRALSCFSEAIILADLSHPGGEWRLLYANDAWGKLTAIPHEASLKLPFWELLQPAEGADRAPLLAAARAAISRGEPFAMQLDTRHGPQVALVLSFRPATNDHISEHIPLIGIPNFVELGAGAGGSEHTAAHYFVVAKELGLGSPRDVLQRQLSRHSSLGGSEQSAPALLGSHGSGGSGRQRFGLERPEAMQDLKLGPLLGRGSYGRVYRGVWRGAVVAVKVLDGLADAGTGAGARGEGTGPLRLRGPLLEAMLSCELSHPNVVRTYGTASRVEEQSQVGLTGEELGGGMEWSSGSGPGSSEREAATPGTLPPLQRRTIWIIQQYCSHGTLYDATDRGWLRMERDLDGATNMPAVLQTAQEIASAVKYLHARGIVHGDLSGNNILLASSTKDTRQFTAQVADFGLSKIMAEDAPIETASIGTVSHMPPEAMRDGTMTKAADAWSFGVLLWEMFCHKRAWCGRRVPQIVHAVASLGKRLEMPDAAPPAYKALAESCMHTDREARPSFDSILSSLEVMLEEVKQGADAGDAGGAGGP